MNEREWMKRKLDDLNWFSRIIVIVFSFLCVEKSQIGCQCPAGRSDDLAKEIAVRPLMSFEKV